MITQAQRESNARTIFSGVVAGGFTPLMACYGMLASAEGESSLDPRAVGDKGAARGLWQWHGDRRAKILAGCGIDVGNADAAGQVKGLLWELSHTELACGTALRAYDGKDGAEACRLFVTRFERSANPARDVVRRTAYGANWARFLGL